MPSPPALAELTLGAGTAGNTLVLFDVDETLTKARRGIKPEMAHLLAELRKKAVVGFVGGSNLPKIREQLEDGGGDGPSTSAFQPRRRERRLLMPLSRDSDEGL